MSRAPCVPCCRLSREAHCRSPGWPSLHAAHLFAINGAPKKAGTTTLRQRCTPAWSREHYQALRPTRRLARSSSSFRAMRGAQVFRAYWRCEPATNGQATSDRPKKCCSTSPVVLGRIQKSCFRCVVQSGLYRQHVPYMTLLVYTLGLSNTASAPSFVEAVISTL